MNKKLFILQLFLLIASPIGATSQSNVSSDDVSLTIYTYDSLLADPGYQFDRAFEAYANLPNNSVNVVFLPDASSILTKANAEKDSPIADVLIGIDNVLVNQIRELDLLTPYQPSNSQNLNQELVSGLASDYLLTPYDFGVISLWHLNNSFTNSINANEFQLNDILSPDFQNQLIIQNPQLSSPGLGFLLSTIALFGDEEVTSLDSNNEWDNFWRELSASTTITSSWGDAIELLYTEEANKSIMVSYTTSPAYGACLYDDTTTSALLPTINSEKYGWQQIEGLGIVKNSPNMDLAKSFVDWFVSDELQSQIYLNQWMYPANENVAMPDCYNQIIPYNNIKPLNNQISSDLLSQNLDNWLQQWELAWVEGVTDTSNLNTNNWYHVLSSFIAIMIIRLNKRFK